MPTTTSNPDIVSIGEEAIEAHTTHQGKIQVVSLLPVNTAHELCVAYTPGVGAVVQAIVKDPASARRLTFRATAVAIVTDGSAVLGFGNVGPIAADPVMTGKAALLGRFGKRKNGAPINGVPILLATQDVEEIIQAVKMIAPSFAAINLEDISAPRCFEIERRLREELDIPVMHDDQHGTAMVVTAAMYNALKVTGRKAADTTVVVNGAGAAGNAIALLLKAAGVAKILVVDTKGAIYAGRPDVTGAKAKLAEQTNPDRVRGTLADALVGADAFVGVSKAGLLKRDMIRRMRADPIVFALANPEPEIMPEEARAAGAAVIATGRSDFPNQINNSLIFPGFYAGLLDSGKTRITDAMELAAARALAALVPSPTPDRILPSMFEETVAEAVAGAVMDS